MRRLPVAGCLLLLAACATSQPDGPPPAAAVKPDPQITALQTSMTELLERLDVMNERIAKLEKANEEPAQTRVVARPAAEAPTAAQKTPLKSADAANAYRNAVALYGQGRLVDARNAFQRVFDSDPSGELADNALFWIGGTYYSAGNYNEAIRFYKRVADEYGDQNKAPDALYMLALAYEKTGDLALARTTLQQVIARYPYSAPAASAKSELNRIKY